MFSDKEDCCFSMDSFPKEFGIMLGCAEHQVAVTSFPFIQGMAKRANSPDNGPAGRALIKAAHDVMVACGYENTAPRMHLLLVAEQPAWNPHCQDVMNHVAGVLQVMAPMEKVAFSDVMSGIGTAARGVGYGSIGAGAGLGALYWLLSRHVTQDDADIEAKQQQADYYHSLSRELKDSMDRKYRYTSVENAKPKRRQPQVVQ